MHKILVGVLCGALAAAGALGLALQPDTQPAEADTKPITLSAATYLQPPRAAERFLPLDRPHRAFAHDRISRGAHRAELRIEARAERRRQAHIAARKARIARERAAREAAREREQERQVTASIGGGAGYTGIAVAIANCESGGNPTAQNPSSSASGLFQFIDGTWSSVTGLAPPASAYSVETQVAAFWKLWNGGAGAGNWAPSQHCWG